MCASERDAKDQTGQQLRAAPPDDCHGLALPRTMRLLAPALVKFPSSQVHRVDIQGRGRLFPRGPRGWCHGGRVQPRRHLFVQQWRAPSQSVQHLALAGGLGFFNFHLQVRNSFDPWATVGSRIFQRGRSASGWMGCFWWPTSSEQKKDRQCDEKKMCFDLNKIK